MRFRCCEKNFAKNECVSKAYSFLHAISDKNRLQIICILQKGPRCGCEIVPILGISEKLASHHLRQLKKAEILDEKREGNFRYYSINKKIIKEYKKTFNQLINL